MKTPTRILSIEDFNPNGRFAKISGASLLRLKGRWLKDAGFHAGEQIAVTNISPGVIELRVQTFTPFDASYVTAVKQLNAVLNEDSKSPGTIGSV